ncbi:unnamed protein product [Larinioides sclopetarius]|uniref:Uncharacterized protein n=1 Tax=Larinioides sclopetarius TaxID=280406 RepID=A0AAV1ZT93_9ARAC
MPQPHQNPKAKRKNPLPAKNSLFKLVIRDGIIPSSRLPLSRCRVSQRSGPRSSKEEFRTARMHGHVRQIQICPPRRSLRRVLRTLQGTRHPRTLQIKLLQEQLLLQMCGRSFADRRTGRTRQLCEATVRQKEVKSF